ncbi:hypothetical protein [Halosegnis longus]|uniref:hypothetical protein n=1 Tax=Halosegnis longus TaxID=2216012 RepID=UPI00129EBDF6|nr:hypothetical protein [Halosegnis longus]
MTDIETILTSIASVLNEHDHIPNDLSYSVVELDKEGQHRDVELPVLELKLVRAEKDESRNTTAVGDVTDENENHTGTEHEDWWSAVVYADILTPAGQSPPARAIGTEVRDVLKIYDTSSLDQPLPDPSGEGILSDITSFTRSEISTQNDFSLSHSLRGDRTRLEIDYEDAYTSNELLGDQPFIESVDVGEIDVQD